jgi:L-asparaginase
MPTLVIHGGAGTLPEPRRRHFKAGSLARIAEFAYGVLCRDGAVEAVVEAVRRLENDPLFNAGTGAKLQSDGVARLSASLMDGARERFSGVVNVEGLPNPVLLCRHLLEHPDRVLAGAGALAAARELGLPEGDVRTSHEIELWQNAVAGKTGTVGAVALDGQGRLAAATSTGGRGMERVGRVSDSCTVAGNFATCRGAAAATGVGEQIVETGLCVRLVAALEAGLACEAAVGSMLATLRAHERHAGFILVDPSGAYARGHSTPFMSWHAIRDGVAAGFTP